MTAQGTRVSSTSYGADGMIASTTDPLERTTRFTRDAVGRVIAEERPDLAITALAYDLEGNNTAVIPPSKPTHGMTYNLVELLDSYTPPALSSGGGATEYSYDLDRALTEVVQPGPRVVEHSYDSAGRLQTTSFPGGVITRSYHPTTGKLSELSGPDVTLSYQYDGALLTQTAMTGPVTGSVSWQHDTAFRVIEEKINGAHAAAFTFDDDDLLTGAGGLTLTRDPVSGFVTQATAGTLSEAWTYNVYGEVETYSATNPSGLLLAFGYTRDDLGRIVEKTETTSAGTRVLVYENDLAGRLIAVYEDGLLAESYGYDDNGNRLSSLNADGVFDASFDDQERLLEYGDDVFTWTDNGELYARTDAVTGDTTTFAYDAVGTLRGVGLPSGEAIEYIVDGQGRRVGKKLNGALVKAWLWRGQLQPVAELDAAGNVVARYVYAGGVNVPALVVTQTATYRLVTDHLGSVRRVVDVATGAIVQELEYDAWGRVLLDTNPGLQPFGYAGGLYDPDTGLVRFGARDYYAETGRWIAKDPIRFDGGENFYQYSQSDPANQQDPRGLCSGVLDCAWAAGEVGAGIGAGVAGGAAIAAFGIGAAILTWGNTTASEECATQGINCGDLPVEDSCGDEAEDAFPPGGDDDPDCTTARRHHLTRAGIRGQEHAFKEEHGAVPRSRFDICACSDGTIKIASHGHCGFSGPKFGNRFTDHTVESA